MYGITILYLMLMCHILDDFVLQGTCLVNLKQKSWWEKNVLSVSNSYRSLYNNDYKMGLFMHCLSWSIMIHLPLIFSGIDYSDIGLTISIILNLIIHYIVDDLKANKYKINLIIDQSIHISQIIITYFLFINLF